MKRLEMALFGKIHVRDSSIIRVCAPGEKSSPELYCYQEHSRRNDTRVRDYSLVYAAKEITQHSHFSAFRGVISAPQNAKSC